MKILIDNGHGSNTAGKHSPDRRLLEYAWTREVAQMVTDTLKAQGYDAERIVPEQNDISLSTRTKRVNTICARHGAKNVLLVSLHVNAACGAGWNTATGWTGWVAPNASSNSKKLAQLLYEEASKRNLRGNRSVPSCKYWVGNFAIVRDTQCPAVLTENLFQDNKADVDFLLSEQGKQAIVNLHVEGIKKYIKEVGK